MRAFATIKPTFWTRGSGKKLRGNPAAQALAFYVMTAPSSNMIGLYYCPITTIARETGIPVGDLPEVFKDISEIAKYDPENEFVWVPEAAAHQVGESLKPNDKRRAQIVRDAEAVDGHPFALEFFAKYSAAYGLSAPEASIAPQGLTTNSEAPSKGLPADQKPRSPVLSSSDQPLPDQDQDPISASPEDLTGSARESGVIPAAAPVAPQALPARQLSAAARQELSFTACTPEDRAVLEAWRDRYGKTDVVFTADRTVFLAERRNEGITQQDALDAVAGAAGNAWFTSQSSKFSLLFNKRERFEEFRDLGRAARLAKGHGRRGSASRGPWVDPDKPDLAKIGLPDDIAELSKGLLK